MQCTGWLSKGTFKADVPLPLMAAFSSRVTTSADVWAGGKVNASGSSLRNLEIECIQNLASGREQQRACCFHWLPVCATSPPVI